VIWGAERTKRVVELARNLQKEQQEEIEYFQLKNRTSPTGSDKLIYLRIYLQRKKRLRR